MCKCKHKMRDSDFELLKKNIISPIFNDMRNYSPSLIVDDNDSVSNAGFNRVKKEIMLLKDNSHKHMRDGCMMLDRHKLSACVCGGILRAKPLVEKGHGRTFRQPNEFLALMCAIENLKAAMLLDYFENGNGANMSVRKYTTDKGKIHVLKMKTIQNFNMDFPEVLIRDKTSYSRSLMLALNRLDISSFDIWTYAVIMYHLEIHNLERLDKFVKDIYRQECN